MKNSTDFLTYGLGLIQVLLFFRIQSISERISYFGPVSFQNPGIAISFLFLAACFLLFFFNLNTVRNILFRIQDQHIKDKANQALFSQTVFLIALILASSLLTRFL